MAKPKKPRNKRYTPREVHIPMRTETRADLALRLRMSIEALIGAPSVETYNAVSLQLVTLGRVADKHDFMELAKAAMLDVFSRFERVGKIGISDGEAQTLRATSGAMDAAIALVPVNKFAAAQAKTERWCRENNVAS